MQDSTNHMHSHAGPSQLPDSLMILEVFGGARSISFACESEAEWREDPHTATYVFQYATSPSTTPVVGEVCHPTTTRVQSSQLNYEDTLDETFDNGLSPGSLQPAPILVGRNINVAQLFNSSINQSSTTIDEPTLQNDHFLSSSNYVESHIGSPGSGWHTQLHFSSGLDAPIDEAVFTWDQHDDMTIPVVPGLLQTSNLNAHHHPGSILGSSTHVSEPALMNGGRSPLTNDFQFANAGELDHELSFPMQTPEATFMQGQLDGTYAWGDTGLAGASHPHNGHASLGSPPLSVPNSSPQPSAAIPCNYPTCNKTFKRDSDRSRHEFSIHFKTPELHVCPNVGCQKSYGKGYSRPDKVTGHLWKKHANLGFTKA